MLTLVGKAIAWARRKKVDVISMSFIIREDVNEALRDQISEASKEGIVMTCSAHDEGLRTGKVYPASYHGEGTSLFCLAASDEYGKPLRQLEDMGYDYMIRGKDVAAGAIPFLKSEDSITGSSVSTAIAAGLSSLILTCDRLSNPSKDYTHGTQEGSRNILVRNIFEQMCAPGTKFIPLENFSQIEALARRRGEA